MYSCDGKAEFSASLLQSSVSHDPADIILICWFAARKTFHIIIRVENRAAKYFGRNYDTFSFMNRKFHGQHLFAFIKVVNKAFIK